MKEITGTIYEISDGRTFTDKNVAIEEEKRLRDDAIYGIIKLQSFINDGEKVPYDREIFDFIQKNSLLIYQELSKFYAPIYSGQLRHDMTQAFYDEIHELLSRGKPGGYTFSQILVKFFPEILKLMDKYATK